MSEKKTVHLTINGVKVEAEAGESVMVVAERAGFDIPSLCFLKDINEIAACRLCVAEVDINGRPMRGLPATCVLKAEEGMNVRTNTLKVREAVKTNLELILANHDRECLSCIRNGNCELQALCERFGIRDVAYKGEKRPKHIDNLSYSIIRDSSKCILCGRCINVCRKVQGLGVLDFFNRGFKTEVGPAFDYSMRDVNCVYCGQCIEACPTAALRERSYIDDVMDHINDPEKVVIVQTAPAVRAGLGEEFGLPYGTPVTGKMTAALHRMGFDYVFDTNFGADLTIMEEANELLDRIHNGGKLPMITSCSPGWVRFAEMYYPELTEHLSTCKSPMLMLGATIKSYFAKKKGIDPKNIINVAIMPCTSKKTEANRPEMEVDGLRDVDYSLTTRELASFIKMSGIRFHDLPDEKPDPILGDYTGAGVIFGTTGGVMEAALRTAADVLTGEDLPDFEYEDVRGMKGLKESSVTVPINGEPTTLNIAVCSSTLEAKHIMDEIREGKSKYHFIEIMACPGGCINGGGQPYVSAKVRMKMDVRPARAKALYYEDKHQELRKSYKNPDIQEMYKEFFGKPNGELSHKYLHTHYHKREFYPQEPCPENETAAQQA